MFIDKFVNCSSFIVQVFDDFFDGHSSKMDDGKTLSIECIKAILFWYFIVDTPKIKEIKNVIDSDWPEFTESVYYAEYPSNPLNYLNFKFIISKDGDAIDCSITKFGNLYHLTFDMINLDKKLLDDFYGMLQNSPFANKYQVSTDIPAIQFHLVNLKYVLSLYDFLFKHYGYYSKIDYVDFKIGHFVESDAFRYMLCQISERCGNKKFISLLMDTSRTIREKEYSEFFGID